MVVFDQKFWLWVFSALGPLCRKSQASNAQVGRGAPALLFADHEIEASGRLGLGVSLCDLKLLG